MNLYSRKRFLTSTLLVLACAGFAGSAMAQKRKTHKLRATAVVEVTTDAKGVVTTHVLPVTILDNGLFNDASDYKATPRPMALENGIVYEAQTSGIPVGTATIISGANAGSWSAIGQWRVITAASKKPDAPVAPVEPGSDRPTLHRSANSGSDASSASSSSPKASPTPAPGANGDSSGSGSGSSDDRPTLHRPASSSSDASPTPTPAASGTPASGSSNTSASAPSSTSSSDSDRPTLHRPAESASPTPSPTPAASGTLAPSTSEQNSTDNASVASSDPDRPTLRKRNSPQPEGPPSPPSSDQKATAGNGTKTAAKPVAAPGTTKVYAAVSDTEYLEPRSFDFKWKPEEAKTMDLKMRKLVVAQLPKEKMPLTPNSLKNVSMRSFDMDLSNDAVIVMSAELPITAPATKETSAKFFTRYVTVVARVDFEGEPQKVLANVTDSSRQDVTPRLELIDAIDVDGDGIAELLFRQYGDQDKSFIIYSIGRSIANKLFEGAITSH